jgi:hypothetical protein
MEKAVEKGDELTLLDVEPLTPKEIGEIAKTLMDKMRKHSFHEMTTDEQVILRMIRSYYD